MGFLFGRYRLRIGFDIFASRLFWRTILSFCWKKWQLICEKLEISANANSSTFGLVKNFLPVLSGLYETTLLGDSLLCRNSALLINLVLERFERYAVIPQIVSADTILFWIWKL